MRTTVTVATASHVANNPPASVGSPIVLPAYLGEPPTARQRQLIVHVMAKVWGILSPREFQVRAIGQLVFHPKTCLYLIRKTGEGKSVVVLTSATPLRGITLVVVSLLGLGCDQVAKAHFSKLRPIIWMRIVVRIS
jgi:superfamily II DNA helicase RecQ